MKKGSSDPSDASVLPFQNIFKYFRVYHQYLGNRLYLVFFLTFLIVATEGVGIALLLPLLMALDVGQGSAVVSGSAPAAPSGLAVAMHDIVAWLGIQNSLTGILIVMCLIFLLKGFIKFIEGSYKSYLQAQLMYELRSRMLDAYSGMDYSYYSRYNTGHFVNVINAQIGIFAAGFDGYKHFLAALIMVAGYFTFAFLVSWKFATMALCAGGLILLIFRGLSNYVRTLSRKTADENGRLDNFLVQTMQAFKYLTATDQIGFLRRSVMQSILRLTHFQRNQGIASALIEALREPLAIGVLVVFILVQLRVLGMALAPIMVALLLIYRAMGQVIGLQGLWQKTLNTVGSLELVEQEFKNVTRSQEPSGGQAIDPLRERIQMRQVNFNYEAHGPAVLKDINLKISANSTVAFVGESGAGKSTLVDLLTLMLRPTRGELRIDGVCHRDIQVDSWRKQIGYVSQETVVFDDSIANNICLWRGDYNTDLQVRANVEAAAAQAHAMRFINDMPDGFNTRVGDRGILLSGGQQQRLFIARELYKKPRLLILDEATSALDSESELVIKQSIDQLKGETTVVIIAHRLSTIKNTDYIYVLDKGRIIEQGSYAELVATGRGSFSRMVALQST